MYAYYFDHDQPIYHRYTSNNNRWSEEYEQVSTMHEPASDCFGSDVESVQIPAAMVSDQESKYYVNTIDQSVGKNGNSALDISKLVSQSSQGVLSEEVIKLLNKVIEQNNDLTKFSQLLDQLKQSNNLDLYNNMLPALPELIGTLQDLVTLNLSHNKLTELPDSLSALKNLETLDLSNNQLETLPNSYGDLKKLKTLDLSNNSFKIIPKCIRDGMITLKALDISQNLNIRMNIIPCTKNLEKFHAKSNGNCNKFPDWVITPKFFKLNDVDLSRTKFDVYSFVGKEGFLNIKSLSMTCSNLSNTVLDMMIENMVCLEKMNVSNEEDVMGISGNIFNEMPTQLLKNTQTMTELNFRATSLPSVTPKINQLVNLKKLDVGFNCLMWLPEEICALENLECLIVDGNSLFMLPENIGNLKSLKELKANNNALARLPKTFEKLRVLRWIDLYDNKLEKFPCELLKMSNLQGLDVEQNFFSTDCIKLGDKPYSELYNTYLAYHKENSKFMFDERIKSYKKCESIKSDKSIPSDKFWSQSSDDDASEKNFKNTNVDSDNDWDKKNDTDDEFDPQDPKIVYDNGKSKNYMYQKPQGFCPEDLHLKRIKAEVASMRVYGSLQTFKIQEGQFDDA
ncbi:leucine-rich repeat protein SHOC-2-like [Copidosoma floridanum]|uniref:leucine-rich repeat protein SHOC-2-like n=1 Tax=Copidosoma floridanum TaxID=29053 RepID=UPI0006C9832C|nr:leucine-rich repeat protein SHOC-2-like [Copidosoma floridanum]